MRLRFSLRTLFIAAAIVAIACYWLVLPTIQAQRFVAAVNSKNFERADTCFRAAEDRFLYDDYQHYWRFRARATLEPWTFYQALRGHRLVRLSVAHSVPPRDHDAVIVATRRGLLSPQISRRPGGSLQFELPLIERPPTS